MDEFDREIDESRRADFERRINTWMQENNHNLVGEIGIGLKDGEPNGEPTHDEKLKGTFHLAFGGYPDDKSTAWARHESRFPYEPNEDIHRHYDIIMEGRMRLQRRRPVGRSLVRRNRQ